MKTKSSKIKLTIIGIVAIIVIISGIVAAKLWAQKVSTIHQSLQRFSYILNLVINDYVKEVNTEELIKSSIEGMLNALDPYSNFLDVDEYKELKVKTEGEFGGIGIQIGMRDNVLTVISPIEGTPAYRLGLQAGDKIVKIEGKSTEGYTVQDAIKQLRGTPGTKVNISIKREGVAELLDFTIVREIIKIKSVPYAGKLTSDIGYVRLADFSKVARTELESAIDSLFTKEKIKKLVFDLRSNSGGLLQEGFEVTDLFLPPGKTVVIVKGRKPETRREFVAIEQDKYGEYPLVVLVDRGSASASEIVAGAIQDWERGLLIGDTTFGKGSVQTIHPIDENSAVKLTTAYWYTPSGRCINKPVKTSKAVIEEDTSSKTKQKYFTKGKGRWEVYGEGAIAPDLYMAYRRYSELETKLISQGIIFDFAVKYLARHKEIKPDFVVTNEMLDELKTMATEKKIEFTDSQFDSVKAYISQELEREIKTKLSGTQGDYEVRLKYDEHVKKAIELLEKAHTNWDLFKMVKK
ncbi:MAG: S41 family peptidase [candidate division WOR-3 bacterium]